MKDLQHVVRRNINPSDRLTAWFHSVTWSTYHIPTPVKSNLRKYGPVLSKLYPFDRHATITTKA